MRMYACLGCLAGLMALGFPAKCAAAEPATTNNSQKASFVVTGRLVEKGGKSVTNETLYVFPFEKGYLETKYEKGRIANPRGKTDTTGAFRIVVPLDFIALGDKFTLGIQQFVGFPPQMHTRCLTKNSIQLVLSLAKDDTVRKVPVGDIVVEKE